MNKDWKKVGKDVSVILVYLSVCLLCIGAYLLIVFTGKEDFYINILDMFVTSANEIATLLTLTSAFYLMVSMMVLLFKSQKEEINDTYDELGISFSQMK